MALKENSLVIFNYVREHDGEDITAKDITEATGIAPKSVTGCINAMVRYQKILVREEVEVLGGKEKFIRLTDAGREFDPEAPAEK